MRPALAGFRIRGKPERREGRTTCEFCGQWCVHGLKGSAGLFEGLQGTFQIAGGHLVLCADNQNFPFATRLRVATAIVGAHLPAQTIAGAPARCPRGPLLYGVFTVVFVEAVRV